MIKRYIPRVIKKRIKRILRKNNWRGNSRIFCISMQRTGTTSVGDFFKHFGYPTAGWNISKVNSWPNKWLDGNFEAILSSKEFLSYQVFEDAPWWYPEFYKVLYHRFPNAKFILLIRESNLWFKSMVNHSKGKTLGNTLRHCKIYRREKDFYNKLEDDPNFQFSSIEEDNLLELTEFEEHYKSIYEIRNREIIDFFNSKKSESLIVCDLIDKDKWRKIGDFVGLNVTDNFEMHSNQSKINK